uniref:J domain-containing protein n=1 Tax=Ananas comosus var. bracteatus TaxID=296719 RepID=A0A6V7PC41_ANACO|nr:unnamed protein product [Ananas comosus var. bracteatus]
MDSNKDEAERCLKKAESAVASGDKQRAIKFIRIAQRLNPNLPIDDLLAASEKLDGSNFTTADQVIEETKSSTDSGPSNGDRSYTEEHVRLIREIKRNKDYYAILGVEKSCLAEEIRRAYRKLSLKVHPDKNTAPGAEEAFKSVCKAFKCLSDEQLRQDYDQVGVVDDHEYEQQAWNTMMRRRRRRATRNEFFDEDFDADEIFRSFFYGSQGDVFHAHNVYRPRGMGGNEWIIIISIRHQEYSLQKSYNHRIPKVTEKHGVEYFVRKEDFEQRFPQGSSVRDNLENHVLRDYKSILGRYCHFEMQRRQWAKNYPTPHCDKLRSLAAA